MEAALVQFKSSKSKYYFLVKKAMNIKKGDIVVAQSNVGLELAEVFSLRKIVEKDIENALKPILRIASNNDLINESENIKIADDVLKNIKIFSLELNLNMKILDARLTLDRSKIHVTFESEERVDFRDLIKKIIANYPYRLELKQIGSRDIAKKIGGIGPCGLILCCSSFIGEFDSVSIKMAKNQNLSLNPKKVSGVCGKLLCCLKYEDNVYEELKNLLPDVNNKIQTEKGMALVTNVNFIAKKIKVKYLADNEFADEWLSYEDLARFNEVFI